MKSRLKYVLMSWALFTVTALGPHAWADELLPRFSSIRQGIFIPKCGSCHGERRPAMGVDVLNYERLVVNPPFTSLVLPGRPDDSELYISVKWGRMPRRFGRLSAEELRAISDWIAAGALND